MPSRRQTEVSMNASWRAVRHPVARLRSSARRPASVVQSGQSVTDHAWPDVVTATGPEDQPTAWIAAPSGACQGETTRANAGVRPMIAALPSGERRAAVIGDCRGSRPGIVERPSAPRRRMVSVAPLADTLAVGPEADGLLDSPEAGTATGSDGT